MELIVYRFIIIFIVLQNCCNVVHTLEPFNVKGPCPRGKTLKGGKYCWSKMKFDIGAVSKDIEYSSCCKLCPETFQEQLSLLEVSETSKNMAYERFKPLTFLIRYFCKSCAIYFLLF